MKYFTDNPLERLMMETPCEFSHVSEAYWQKQALWREKQNKKKGTAAKTAAPSPSPRKRKEKKA